MSMIALSIVMAITVEDLLSLEEHRKAALDGDRKTAATQLAALIISCALCMAAGADVYDALGVSFAVPWLGMVLTGIPRPAARTTLRILLSACKPLPQTNNTLVRIILSPQKG